MSIEILTDTKTGNSCMYCNTTEWAFGPVFGEDEDIMDFFDWCDNRKPKETDPRIMTDKYLEHLVDKWRKEVKENEAEAAGERANTERNK